MPFFVYMARCTENGLKNRSGTYKEKAGDNKVVKHYANTQLSNRCYVFLLRFYLQKLAPKVLEDPDSVFYWKPRDVVPASDSTPWFTLQVIGRNVLASMVKRMFQEVGIDGKTNHSLRATGATRLFEANVLVKLIKERTGHKSLDALRLYERTSSEQQKSVANLMCSSSKPNEFQFSSPAGGNTSSVFSSSQTMFKNFNNCTFNITFNPKVTES